MSAGDHDHLFSFLGPIPQHMLDSVPEYKPVGSLKRLQSVIEMVNLDEDEDDYELSMDDLLAGASWTKFPVQVKMEAMEVVKTKDPNESFKLVPEIAAVKLEGFKMPEVINVEPSEDENNCDVVFLEYIKKGRKQRCHERGNVLHTLNIKDDSETTLEVFSSELEMSSSKLEEDLENYTPETNHKQKLHLTPKAYSTPKISSFHTLTTRGSKKTHQDIFTNIVPKKRGSLYVKSKAENAPTTRSSSLRPSHFSIQRYKLNSSNFLTPIVLSETIK